MSHTILVERDHITLLRGNLTLPECLGNGEGSQDSTESNHFQWGDAAVVQTFVDRAAELTQGQYFWRGKIVNRTTRTHLQRSC